LPQPIGLYGYPKYMSKGKVIPCVVRVFPLEVEGSASRFPEAGQRRRKWFAPEDAARRARETELARSIREFEIPAEAASKACRAGGRMTGCARPLRCFPDHPIAVPRSGRP